MYPHKEGVQTLLETKLIRTENV